MVTCPDKSHNIAFARVAKELVNRGHEIYYCIRNADYDTNINDPSIVGINYKIINNWFTEQERLDLREYLTTLGMFD